MDARSTNPDIRIASSATAVPVTTSSTRAVADTPIDVSSVTTPAATVGICAPAAEASRVYSMNPSRSSTSATAKKAAGGANQTVATAIATSTAPLRTRVMESRDPGWTGRKGRRGRKGWKGRTQRFFPPASPALPALPARASLGRDRDWRCLESAVAAVALLIGEHGLEQMAAAEIGPQRFGDPDLGVRDLPEQDVADAHLAARPDQQIRIGLPGGVEEVAEATLVEIIGTHAGGNRATRRVHDFRASTVVERDVEQHAGVGRGLRDAHRQLGLHVGGELVGSADHLEPDVVLQERAELEADVALQQRHQRVHFGARTLPVLRRERIQRQHVDAEPRRRFDDIAYRLDAGTMSLDARQVALRRPPAVPVHDDGDVRRQLVEVDLPRQCLVRRSRRSPRQELLKRHEKRVPRE